MELQIPNTIQPREYSRGGGPDGFSHIRGGRGRQPELPISESGRHALERELELARQRLQSGRARRRLWQLTTDGNQ